MIDHYKTSPRVALGLTQLADLAHALMAFDRGEIGSLGCEDAALAQLVCHGADADVPQRGIDLARERLRRRGKLYLLDA